MAVGSGSGARRKQMPGYRASQGVRNFPVLVGAGTSAEHRSLSWDSVGSSLGYYYLSLILN
jgi:hypothetical protein